MNASNAHNIVVARLRALRAGNMPYRAIAARYGATAGMVYRMINEGYEPKTVDIRRKFGYPIECPNCGCEFYEQA